MATKTYLEQLIDLAVHQRAVAVQTGKITDYGQANATRAMCKRVAREQAKVS